MGRPTDDRKPSNLIVRINDETKDELRKKADSRGITVSEYIREVIALHNSNNALHNDSFVMQNNTTRLEKESAEADVELLQERIIELEADNVAKQERIAELEILNEPVEQLENRIKELESQSTVLNLSYDTENELKDTLRMIELSSSKEQVPLFLKNLHDRLESGEFQIENGKLKLGYTEVFEVLDRAETRKWLSSVWDACDTKKKAYQEGLRMVFCEGAKKATEIIYGED